MLVRVLVNGTGNKPQYPLIEMKTYPEHRKRLCMVCSMEVIGINGPDHTTSDSKVIDQLTLDRE
jgi:hypothetical protein